jgi:hypothetical protein
MRHPRCLLIRCCPACRSFDVRRSHRRGLLEAAILPVLMMRPFRCEDCGKRHYNLVWTRALPGHTDIPSDEDPVPARK